MKKRVHACRVVKVWMLGEENTELFICPSMAHITHTSVLLNNPLMSNQTFSSIKSYTKEVQAGSNCNFLLV